MEYRFTKFQLEKIDEECQDYVVLKLNGFATEKLCGSRYENEPGLGELPLSLCVAQAPLALVARSPPGAPSDREIRPKIAKFRRERPTHPPPNPVFWRFSDRATEKPVAKIAQITAGP